MSCVPFSIVNQIQAQLNYLIDNYKLSQKALSFLNDNGYIKNGRVYISSCHLAITSGTTEQGNYFQKVWDTVRNQGVIPEDKLVWTGSTWTELHNPNKVTDEMTSLAKQFTEIMSVEYAWLVNDWTRNLNQLEKDDFLDKLNYSPIEIGIPFPANHSITMYDLNDSEYQVVDHYAPTFREKNISFNPIHFALVGYVSEKIKEYPNYIFERNLKKGMKGEDVKILQDILIIEGFLDKEYNTGFYGALTFNAVKKLQEKYKAEILTPVGLKVGTGLFYASTRNFINNLIK
jgi:hypothetical protein